MKASYLVTALFAIAVSFLPRDVSAAPDPTFTYQGRLTDNGAPASGDYDLQFRLYGQINGGSMIGQVVTNENITVSNGLFSSELNFGPVAFNGGERFVMISVRPGDSVGAYTDLSPRQRLSPVPYAIYASDAAGIGGVPASNFVAKGDTEFIISPLIHERSVVLNRTLNEAGTIDLSTTDASSERRVLFPLDVPVSLHARPQKLKRVSFDYTTIRTTASPVSITDVSVRMLNNVGGYTYLYRDTTIRQDTTWTTVVLQPIANIPITGSIILRIRMTFGAAADTFSVGTIKAAVGE